MPLTRGDIVFYEFTIPDTGQAKSHPALIISTSDVYDLDECYICVMLSTTDREDVFSFVIDDDMLVYPNEKPFSQVRTHLITYVRAKSIALPSPFNKMKQRSVNRVVAHIAAVNLGYELD